MTSHWTLIPILTFSLISGASAQPEQQPAHVRVDLAQSMEMAPVIDLPATVISRNDSRIATEIAGRVTWITDIGNALKQGDIIAKLDDAFLQIQLKNAKATVQRLQARLAFEERQVIRFEELATTHSTPAQRVDEVKMNRDVTKQELASAGFEVERINLQIDRTVVRAPFNARVVERRAQIGEYAPVGSEIARVVDIENLEARVQAPLNTTAYIHEGMALSVKNGEDYGQHQIRTIVPVGDEISRTIEIRIALPAEKWVIGTPLRISVPTDTPRQTIVIPRDALILRRDESYVFRVNADAIAERIAVRTGAASGDFIEVFGAIQDGDALVIRGGERLQPGRLVTVIAES